MFNRPKRESKYDAILDEVFEELSVEQPGNERYRELVKNLQDLERLRKEVEAPTLDPNKVLMVAGNIAGIVTILSYEQTRVIGSKALSFVLKAK